MFCTIFDQVALDYDQVRPGYPEELVEDVVFISAIPKEERILEIGCWTDQATISFAKRGYSMTCLEIGGELAAVAREKRRQFPKVHILTISFKNWQPEPNSFDLIISATAFHWIPPEVAYPKAARVLKDSGYIALFWNLHPTPCTGFFREVQRIYRNAVPEWGNPR